jgi:hypothetical protein
VFAFADLVFPRPFYGIWGIQSVDVLRGFRIGNLIWLFVVFLHSVKIIYIHKVIIYYGSNNFWFKFFYFEYCMNL